MMKIRTKGEIVVFCVIFALSSSYASLSSAGRLSDFESDLTPGRNAEPRCLNCDKSHSRPHRHEHGHYDADDLSLIGDFFELLFNIIDLVGTLAPESKDYPVSTPNISSDGETPQESDQGKDAFEASDTSAKPQSFSLDLGAQEIGDFETARNPESQFDAETVSRKSTNLSYARLNLNNQHVDEYIDGLDFAFELRTGRVGFEFRHTDYKDNVENENLKYDQLQGFYRLTPRNQTVAVDLGLGFGTFNGKNKHDGVLVSLPIVLNMAKNVGIEMRPTLLQLDDSSVRELDLAALYSIGHAAIKFGYRRLSSNSYQIEGPYAGIDLLF